MVRLVLTHNPYQDNPFNLRFDFLLGQSGVVSCPQHTHTRTQESLVAAHLNEDLGRRRYRSDR